MLPLDTWLLFCVACVALVATPGPNVLYLVSRTLAQGRAAGFVSLAGTSTGLGAHALAAAFGLSALLAAIPVAYDVVRFAGAIYLGWLAWTTWRSAEAKTTLAVGTRPIRATRLFRQGLLTALLNPKVALFELALFPQFVSPAHGNVLTQSLLLAATQLLIAIAGDSLFVLASARVRRFFARRPTWGRWSKRTLAGVFAALAARLAFEPKP
ncbi:MAG TPA: LysE family translocator [Casimicrobiaceae bacterium]|jgi:threonine/homoserine/homoserine lactone efflux protein